MASVHRDPRFPKGVWYAHYCRADGKRVVRSSGKYSKREAEIVCQEWQATENELRMVGNAMTRDRVLAFYQETLQRLGVAPIQYITIEGWLRDWLESKTQIADSTRKAYQHAIDQFCEFLGPAGVTRRLDSITGGDINTFAKKLLKEGRSPSTVNKILRKYLSAPFEKAEDLGKLKYNPVMATDPLKAQIQGKEPFTAEQVAQLAKAGRKLNREWEGAILFSYGSGARLSDTMRLEWSSLDTANGICVFRQGKTGAKTTIALHPDFADWLAEEPLRNENERYVLPSLAARPIGGSGGLSLEFLKIMEAADIKQRILREGNTGKGRAQKAYTFHSFRHTAASSVFNSAALKEITRRVTAHAAQGEVDRYIHTDLTALREAVGLIPRVPKV
jgi:integrase